MERNRKTDHRQNAAAGNARRNGFLFRKARKEEKYHSKHHGEHKENCHENRRCFQRRQRFAERRGVVDVALHQRQDFLHNIVEAEAAVSFAGVGRVALPLCQQLEQSGLCQKINIVAEIRRDRYTRRQHSHDHTI